MLERIILIVAAAVALLFGIGIARYSLKQRARRREMKVKNRGKFNKLPGNLEKKEGRDRSKEVDATEKIKLDAMDEIARGMAGLELRSEEIVLEPKIIGKETVFESKKKDEKAPDHIARLLKKQAASGAAMALLRGSGTPPAMETEKNEAAKKKKQEKE